MYSPGTAWLLWFCCLFGFCGLHRIYLGRPVSGIVWFLTFGLLGFGQLFDLLLLSGMADEANRRARALS